MQISNLLLQTHLGSGVGGVNRKGRGSTNGGCGQEHLGAWLKKRGVAKPNSPKCLFNLKGKWVGLKWAWWVGVVFKWAEPLWRDGWAWLDNLGGVASYPKVVLFTSLWAWLEFYGRGLEAGEWWVWPGRDWPLPA